MYRIGVISDTHGMLREEVKEVLKTCDVILHGGDINRQSVLDELEKLAEVYVVRGNNDKEWAAHIPETVSVELYGIRFVMIHKIRELPADIGDWDVAVYGHSHRYEEKRAGGRLWLNPGSCGPGRFGQPVTMAVIETAGDGSFMVKKTELAAAAKQPDLERISPKDMKKLVQAVMKETDRGTPVKDIARRCRIGEELAEQICRLYLTHPGVDVQGILNKMELGNRR